MFNVIFGITGTASVDDFLKHYKENDQANLRLLHHVSQLENEHQVQSGSSNWESSRRTPTETIRGRSSVEKESHVAAAAVDVVVLVVSMMSLSLSFSLLAFLLLLLLLLTD